ncbi:MAG: TIGR02679 family protein [Nitriliruptor sp.]
MPERAGGHAAPVEVDRERLRALLDGDDLAWLRDRVHRRLEAGRGSMGTVTLTDPSAGQRAAIDRLLGRRPSSGARVTVPLDVVDAVLREAGICTGLREAIEVLDGPVVDRAGQRRTTAQAWGTVTAGLAGDEAWQRGWRDDLVGSGLLRRLADDPEHATILLERIRRVLRALPATGIPLAHLAARTLGDSHALDPDRPEATLVLKALQHQHLPPDERGPLPTGVDRRALWAAAGVLLDELSAPVLVWNLSTPGAGLVDQTLRSHAAVGEPVRLTLRALLHHPPDLTGLAGRTVFVCENPTVVAAAADTLGPAGAPLVCSDGQPSAAVQTLLRHLAAAGAVLLHHGDFDRGGLRIATTIIERFGAGPWRMDVASYRAAPAGPTLMAPVEPVGWAPGLAAAVNHRSTVVHEEQVLHHLIDDLRAGHHHV